VFVDRSEADTGAAGYIPYARLVEVGVGENLENRHFKAFLDIGIQFV